MAALRQSIDRAKEAQSKPAEPAKSAPAKAPVAAKGKKAAAANRNLDQREMLLPIAGGAPAKATAEKRPAKASPSKKAG